MNVFNMSRISFGIKILFDVVMSIAIIFFALRLFQSSVYMMPIAIIIGLISAIGIWFCYKYEIYGKIS